MKRIIFITMTLLLLGAGCKGGCGSSTEYNVNEINADNAEETADKILKDLDDL